VENTNNGLELLGCLDSKLKLLVKNTNSRWKLLVENNNNGLEHQSTPIYFSG
jgi:hypothetical protein